LLNTWQYNIQHKNMTNTSKKTAKEPQHCDCDNTVNSHTSVTCHRCLLTWSFISLEKCKTSAYYFLFLSDLMLISPHKMTKLVHKCCWIIEVVYYMEKRDWLTFGILEILVKYGNFMCFLHFIYWLDGKFKSDWASCMHWHQENCAGRIS
jgi:hypothetical protein